MNRFEPWREAFGESLNRSETADKLKSAALTQNLREWTTHLTAAVVGSCQSLGWQAAGKGHRLSLLPQGRQEYLGIDVMAFAELPSVRWPFPIAAFELENHAKDDRVAYSLWKVLCLRVRLRVVFAYRPDWERGRQLVKAIESDVIGGFEPEQRTAVGGETILAIGNRGEGETFPWGYFKFWMLDANLGRFEKV